ncbi:DeoR/GlpR family DNA-binding transcription regulator [Rhodanobacter sp. DHG33]|uniref:DeoR/GlpR family DNA-binding transcription regulator n=1 Tax=Rhodanobacter sp. DHG33 TaxID=2775921 RepID=UPI00178419A5|nr:DeoR/GlpR family DNA-binding transcription regulator [Rhodanobacter sp. DHG33]MBD8899962.1 DeoR/GlpR transcriptional regulator [Rhodanobacter sp. DHG33]
MSKAQTAKTAAKPRHRLLLGERRRLIVEYVEEHGRATVEELAKKFDTSAVTIRADLEALANASAIVRSHGGALPVVPVSSDIPLNIKETRHHAQKLRIGQAAAAMIRDGETIILDSGSTTVEIARQIRQRRFESLTVITNALNIALELSGLPHIRVMMLGGLLRQTSYSLVGPDAEQALAKLSADRLFLGVDGLDPEVGVTTPDPLESALNALMIRVSRQTVAVLDASKLGQRSLSVIAPVRQLHKVISDNSAPAELVETLRAAGVQVELV